MYSVLFVCTANVCRSPMAEGLLLELVGSEIDGWKIGSAGTWTSKGMPAVVNTLKLLAERGIDLTGHRSCQVDQELLSGYQLILTMEQGHKEAIQIEFPQFARRVFLLSEMVGSKFDIEDPMGRSEKEFEVTANEISSILVRGMEKIKVLAQEVNDTE
jgi:protein-tyrosine-phosphatase